MSKKSFFHFQLFDSKKQLLYDSQRIPGHLGYTNYKTLQREVEETMTVLDKSEVEDTHVGSALLFAVEYSQLPDTHPVMRIMNAKEEYNTELINQ